MSKSFYFRGFKVIGFCCLVLLFFLQVDPITRGHAQMQYTGQENNLITLSTAIKLTQNFQATATPSTVFGEYFGKTIFMSILNQSGCVGIRIYYGKKDDGTPVLVLVGVDANGHDLTAGLLGEIGTPCPPYCDSTHTLSH